MTILRKHGSPVKLQPELERFDIFTGLSSEKLEQMEKIITRRDFPAGSYIIQEGDDAAELYLLLEGSVQVSKKLTLLAEAGEEGAWDKSLVKLDSKDAPHFGEMAILKEEHRRSATVKALTDCCVGILDKKKLLSLCDYDKELGYIVMSNIAKRLAKNLEKANQDILKLTTAFSLALQK